MSLHLSYHASVAMAPALFVCVREMQTGGTLQLINIQGQLQPTSSKHLKPSHLSQGSTCCVGTGADQPLAPLPFANIRIKSHIGLLVHLFQPGI